MKVERVDPLTVVDEAARILRAAWSPPAIHYTADYLRWQLGFPGTPARTVLARIGSEAGGFAALTPRRLRVGGAVIEGHVLSFVAVRPTFRRRGLASRLYEEILLVLREEGLPAVVFAEAGSEAAQRPLHRAASRVGLGLRRLAPHLNYGFVARRSAIPGPLVAAEAPLERALEAIEACDAARVLWAAPDLERLEHYGRDPRGRKFLAIKEDGRVTGAAMVFLSNIVSAQGMERIATLDSIFLPAPTADRLSALARAAAAAFVGQTTSPAVSAPSLATNDPAILRAAGFRPTGTVFDAFVCHPEGHPLADADVTNLEVV